MDERTLNMLQTFLSKVILKNTSKKSLHIFGRCYRVSIVLKTGKQREESTISLPSPLGTVNQINQIDNEGNSLTEGTQVIKREMIEQECHDFVTH